MPQVTTGWEPDTSQGWHFEGERVYARGAPGTRVVSGYQDSRVLSIAGFDLWSTVTLDDIASRIQAQGKTCYYLSLWRNPPSFLGTGNDDYRAIAVTSP